jgi:IS5 family transposase
MHQTKKGNQWYFGMKAHIGVDADSGLVHTVTTTAANEADVEQVADLLHGKEQAGVGRLGLPGRAEPRGARRCEWHIAARPSDIAKLPEGRRPRIGSRSKKHARPACGRRSSTRSA